MSPFVELDHTLYQGVDGQGREYLLTVYTDGTRTLASREVGGFSWSAPVLLDEVPAR